MIGGSLTLEYFKFSLGVSHRLFIASGSEAPSAPRLLVRSTSGSIDSASIKSFYLLPVRMKTRLIKHLC